MDRTVDPGAIPSGQALAVPNYATYGYNLQSFPVSFEASEEWKKRMCATAASSQVGNSQPLATGVNTQANGKRKRKLAVAESGRLPDIQPLDMSMRLDAPAGGKKKRKVAAAESGQLKSRWRAHNKATCLCAVCKQVRGELRSTWFNHDRLNCKCSVCKQSRGEKSEKRPPKTIVSAEQRLKLPSVSRRQQRQSGKLPVTTSQSRSIPPTQPLVPGSGVPVGSGWPNLRPAGAAMQMPNGFLAFPGYCWDGSGTNQMTAANRVGVDSGYPYYSPTTVLDTYNAGKPTSSGASPQIAVPSSSPTLTSSGKNSHPDRILLSWKHKTSSSLNTSETLPQPPGHAIPWQMPYRPADFTAHQNFPVNPCFPFPQPPPHILYSQSRYTSSHLTAHTVNPQSESLAMKGRETLSQPPLPAFEPGSLRSPAYMTAELNPCPSDSFAVKESETLAQPFWPALGSYGGWGWGDLRALSTTGHSTHEDSALNCSSSSHSVAQASLFQECPSEGNGATLGSVVPRPNITCDFGQEIKNVEMASSPVSEVVQGGTLHGYKESEASSQDQGGSGCQVDSEETSFGGTGELLIAVSEEEALPCVADKHYSESTSTEKALDLALPLVSKMLPTGLQETSRISKKRKNRTCCCVSKTCECGFCVSGNLSKLENLRPPVIKKITTLKVTRSLRLAEGGVYGVCSPATIRDQSCYSSGSCITLAASNQVQDSSQLRIRNFSRYGKKVLFAPQTSSISATNSLMFFLNEAGLQPRGTPERFTRDPYRTLLRSIEQAGFRSSGSLQVGPVGATKGPSAFDPQGHKRFSLQPQLYRMEISSQKSADIRIHRSQSALLLGEQPCSLLIVAHLQPALQRTSGTLGRGECVTVFGVPHSIQLFTDLLYSGSSGSSCHSLGASFYGSPGEIYRSRYRLEGSSERSQGGIPDLVFLQLLFANTGNGQPVFDLMRLVTLFQKNQGFEKSCRRKLLNSACPVGYDASCSFPFARNRDRAHSSWPVVPKANSDFSDFDKSILVTLLQSTQGVEETFRRQLLSHVCAVSSGVSRSFTASGRERVGSSWPGAASMNSDFFVFKANVLAPLLGRNQAFGETSRRQFQSLVCVGGSSVARRPERVSSIWPGASGVNSDFSSFGVNMLVESFGRKEAAENHFQTLSLSPVSGIGSVVACSPSAARRRERVSLLGADKVTLDCSVSDLERRVRLCQRNQGVKRNFQRQLVSPVCAVGSSASRRHLVARRRERVIPSWVDAAKVSSEFSADKRIMLIEVPQPQEWNSLCGLGSVVACSSSAAWRRERVSLLGADKVTLDFSVSDLERRVRLCQRNQGVKRNFQRQLVSPVCAVGSSATRRHLVARRRESVIPRWVDAAKVSSEFSADKRIMSIEVPQPHSVERFTASVPSVNVVEQRSGDNRKDDNLGFVRPAEPLVKKRRLSCSTLDCSRTELLLVKKRKLSCSAVTAVVCRWARGISDLGSPRAIVGSSEHKVLLPSVSRLGGQHFSNEGIDSPSDDYQNWFTAAQRSDDEFSKDREETEGEKIYQQSRISEYSALTQKSVTLCQIKAELPSSGEVRWKGEERCTTEGNSLPSVLSFQALLGYLSKDVDVKSETIPSIGELESAQTSNTKESPDRSISRTLFQGQIGPRRLLPSGESCSFVPAMKIKTESSESAKPVGEHLVSLGDERSSKRYLLSAGTSLLCKMKASNSVVSMRRDLGEHYILAGLRFREAGQHFSRHKKSSSSGTKFSGGSSGVFRLAPDIRGDDTDPGVVGLSKHQIQELEVSAPLHDGKVQSFLRNSVCKLSSSSSVSPLSAQRDCVIGGGQKASGEGAPEVSTDIKVLTTGVAQASKEQKFTALLQQFISMQQGFQTNKRDADVEMPQSPVSMQQRTKRVAEIECQCAGEQKFTALLQQFINMQQVPENKNKDNYEEAQLQKFTSLQGHFPHMQEGKREETSADVDLDGGAQPPRQQKYTRLQGQFPHMQEGVEREKTGADVDLDGAAQPPRQHKFTSLLQRFINMQHGVGNRESSACLDPGGASEFEQSRLSKGGTVLSLLSSAAQQSTPETSCEESSRAQAIVGSSELGSQFSTSNPPKDLSLNKSTHEGGRPHGQYSSMETQNLEGSTRREREDVDSNKEHSQSNTYECSTVSGSLDHGCDPGAKPLPWGSVRLSAGAQQTRRDGADGTTLGDQRSPRSSCVSFKELLSSVCQSFALPSGETTNAECSSAETDSRMNRTCDGFISSDGQKLQTLNGRKSRACFSGNQSQILDPSYEQLTIISLNERTSCETDVNEDNHKRRSIAGETPGLGGGIPNSCRVKERESTHSGCSEASSSIGKNYATPLAWKDKDGVLSEVVNLLSRIREPAAGNILSDESSFVGPTTFSFTANLSSEHHIFTASDDKPDCEEVEILQNSLLVMREKTEFEQKLKAAVKKPFCKQELLELQMFVSERKPQMRLRESRHDTRHVALEKDGFSYLEHYPEFGRKLESALRPRDKLKLLRGFFFWVQHTCMSGAYMPWEEEEEDDDCIQIVEEKCTAPRQASSDKSKSDGEWSRRNDGVTKGPTHSCSHMSLRARKNVVYTFPTRGKRHVAGHLRTTKVKTEDQTR
ncbi:hypothetical protein R1sor_010065 [Riccia sorocarpa]|uniref:Uncharacterized protein n=1 Tax=Riccia sorocarpa TaxID=122646 RepID=A0ABD3I308_9MARC